MKLGIVLLNYNSTDMTINIAKKLANMNIVDKIIIVDNASTDGLSYKLKNNNNIKIKVLETEKNGGYSYGNNVGAKFLIDNGFEYVCIMNPDVDIEEKDLKIIIENFETDINSEYSILTGIEYNSQKNISDPVIYNLNDYYDDLKECLYFYRRIKKRKQIKLDSNVKIQDIPMTKGSFFIIRSKDFKDINYLDTNVFLYCEERILSKKISIIGKKIGLVTSAKYYHNHKASINKSYKKQYQQIKILYDSRWYYQCNYNNIGLIKKIFLRVFMIISLFEYMLKSFFKE